MDEQPLLHHQIDGIAILILNNPKRRNALSSPLLAALRESLDRIREDSAVRVVVLRSTGPVFSSGHDMRELVGRDAESYAAVFAASTGVMEAIRLLPQPVIAQVHGLATAAGCQLVATCDLAIAADTASFATPGVQIGLFCTTPGVAVSRAVRSKKAMEMLLTGEPISAEEAERLGLVNRVVPPEKLEEETLALARKIISYSGFTIGLGKKAFYEQLPLDLPAAFKIGKAAMVRNAVAQDGQEGMSAFLEKRPPKWSD